jgi:hypothetical protein
VHKNSLITCNSLPVGYELQYDKFEFTDVILNALALLGMTMVIQMFVYPEVWWSVHALWAAFALILMVRSGEALNVDAMLLKARHK